MYYQTVSGVLTILNCDLDIKSVRLIRHAIFENLNVLKGKHA